MSIPDEFFKTEEGNGIASYAQAITIILLVVFLAWAITSYVEKRRAGNLSTGQTKGGALSVEEKYKILDELAKKMGSSTIPLEEKQKILNKLSKETKSSSAISAEEKEKILEALKK